MLKALHDPMLRSGFKRIKVEATRQHHTMHIRPFVAVLAILPALSLLSVAEEVKGQPNDSGMPLSIRPDVYDIGGKKLSETVVLGRQLLLSANFTNDSSQPKPSVAIFEVKDSEGVVVYLAWQDSEIPPSSSKLVGVSWLPASTGMYEIEIFHLPNLINPGIIYGFGDAQVTIIGEQQQTLLQ